MLYLAEMLKQVIRQKRNLHASKDEIKQLQRRKFLQLVQFAALHSPYYSRIIREHNIDIANCKPEDFPVLTKPELIKHFDDIVTDKKITKAGIDDFLSESNNPADLFLGRYIVIHTSGSSGVIGYYVYSVPEFLTGLAPTTRANGVRLGQKVAYIAATNGHFAGATMASVGKKLRPIYRDVRLFDINAPFGQTVTAINQFQPTMIGGYAFALRKLAEAQTTGELHIKPDLVQSGGEPLSSANRTYIQHAFAAPVVNVYASSEHIIMGLGRDSFGGMYLMEDNIIFELGPTGTRLTNLYNYTLPLIRYQMSDQLQHIDDPAPRMPFTKVREIVGRQELVPVFMNDRGKEDFISPLVLAEFFAKGLAQLQVLLTGPKSFVFKACLTVGLSPAERQESINNIELRLRNLLAEKAMTTVTFHIEVVDRLWADEKTGKFALIVRQ